MLLSESVVVPVHVRLLDVGVPCSRPTKAVYLGEGFYLLRATPDYHAGNERWEFTPGSIVKCEEMRKEGSIYLLAFALHPVQLSSLIGKRLSNATRVGGMAMFSFGEDRIVETPRGPKPTAEFALHPQCSWRIVVGEVVLIGSSDLYAPADGSEDAEDFDWDQPYANRQDILMRDLLDGDSSLIVESFEFGRAGVVSIGLGQDRYLEIFPNNSLREEYWRLFRPASDESHLVFVGC